MISKLLPDRCPGRIHRAYHLFRGSGRAGRNDLVIRVCGNGFLYNMVRIIAGTLLDIGQGKRDPMDIFTILEAKDRSAAGPTAPAHGLTLVKYEFL